MLASSPVVPRCLTIAGSDSGGGAGIQADLKAFAALGCHGMSAIVALTAQSTTEVRSVHEAPPEFIRDELEVVFDDIGVDAAKTGMLFSQRIIETVAGFLADHPVPLVVDPVMVAASGAKLLQDDAVEVLVGRLLPLATVVTPNLHEACALAGVPYSDDANREELAEKIHALGASAVIVTGGHGTEAVDWLYDGEQHVPISVERHELGRDPRRRLHALREPDGPSRPRREPRRCCARCRPHRLRGRARRSDRDRGRLGPRRRAEP